MADTLDLTKAAANGHRTLPLNAAVQNAMYDCILSLETKLQALNTYVSSSCLRHNSHFTQYLTRTASKDPREPRARVQGA